MGAKFFDAAGAIQDVELPPQIYSEAAAANLTVSAYLNRKYPTDAEKFGTTFNQMLTSTGLIVPDTKLMKNYGLRAPTMGEVLNGSVNFSAANTEQIGNPAPSTGTSRTLFPAALIAFMETALVKNYQMDAVQFDKMVAIDIAVANDRFEQPQINMSTPNGPNSALSGRRAQLAGPNSMMAFTTSDKTRRIPTYALGMEFSKEALRATTLDLVGMSVARQMMVEKDSWVNAYISDFYAGDPDNATSSLTTLGFHNTTVILDPTCPAGKISQSAWLQWLFTRRKFRVIDWIMCDLPTYLKLEARVGRPSLTAIDTIIPRVEAQATVVNSVIGDVKVFIVDPQSGGGPLPTDTILGLDSRYAIARVKNTSADVTAAENYALRQSEAFMVQFAEMAYRLHDDAFDTLTVSP